MISVLEERQRSDYSLFSFSVSFLSAFLGRGRWWRRRRRRRRASVLSVRRGAFVVVVVLLLLYSFF